MSLRGELASLTPEERVELLAALVPRGELVEAARRAGPELGFAACEDCGSRLHARGWRFCPGPPVGPDSFGGSDYP